MQLSPVAARDDAAMPAHAIAPRRRGRLARMAVTAAATALTAASVASPALAASHAHKVHHAQPHAAVSYAFSTLDNPGDPTFNQLLGINNSGKIAGYFGSGMAGHPNQGYLTSSAPSSGFTADNFPASVQTQVTGINDEGVTVGFWSGTNLGTGANGAPMDANYGFYSIGGRTESVNYPTSNYGTPAIDQLLGVNDEDVAAGFYTDATGNNHGYTYNILTGRFHDVTIPGATSVTATAINSRGDVAGTEVDQSGNTDGFLLTRRGRVITLDVPGASSTTALGVNDHREVVGSYQVGTGSSVLTHGFTWTPQAGFQTVDDPNGVAIAGGTVINGLNDAGQLVGFYTDPAGNVHGMIATPGSQS